MIVIIIIIMASLTPAHGTMVCSFALRRCCVDIMSRLFSLAVTATALILTGCNGAPAESANDLSPVAALGEKIFNDPALDTSEIDDVVAFLNTLTDGFLP